MKKAQKDYSVIETDGTFFEDMRKMERRILEKYGDKEALAILDAEDEARKNEKFEDE